MSYLAAFVAGVLALLSLLVGTGHAATAAAEVAAAFIVLALVLWATDNPRPPTGARPA